MAVYRSAIVNQARSWIGCNEADGSHKRIIDVYNAHKPLAQGYKVKYTDAWCATFVSAVAIKCGATGIIPTECGCERMINLLKNKNSWVERDDYTPQSGDIIFYDWDDSGSGDCTGFSDHVGIVESVGGGYVTLIEGNYSNAVKRRSLKLNARYIRGYGVPKYDAEVSSKKTTSQIVDEVLAGKWGNGDARKKALESAGYDYSEIQAAVNAKFNSPKKETKSVEQVAKEVVQGKWGNGVERKVRLKSAGYVYETIQKKVNELLKR